VTADPRTPALAGDLPGYELWECLHRGRESCVFRGRRLACGSPVVVKLPASDFPDPALLARLAHEYEIARLVSVPGVLPVLALERTRRGFALVSRDLGADSLAQRLAAGPLPLRQVLEIGSRLAAALDTLHSHALVHRDVNPRNVVISRDTGEVTLIDLGLAGRVLRGADVHEAPGGFEGTLAYASPEQTGRMNRRVDTRSDLYSLGVTLYQMLTGHLPFEGRDRVELMHCHIARMPTPPVAVDPTIPR
jgi:serine/threonine protein kinase